MKFGSVILTPTLIHFPLSTHKYFEMEFGKGSDWSVFDCSFRWKRNVDHAGPQFQFEIWKLFFFIAKIYDHRHWNTEQNRWCLPNEF